MIYIFDDNMLLPLLLQRVEKRRLLARLKIEQKTEVLLVQYYDRTEHRISVAIPKCRFDQHDHHLPK